MIDFIDPVHSEKKYWFKSSHFVVGIGPQFVLSKLADSGMPMIIFHLKFEEQLGALFQKGVTYILNDR